MIKLAAKLLFTVFIFWLVLHQVEWGELKETFIRQQPRYLLAAACAILLQTIGGGLRWHHIRLGLGGSESENPTRTTLIYYASCFFNSIMPSTIGSDVVRTYLSKKSGTPLTQSMYGVLIDRIVSLAALGLLVAATLPLLFDFLSWNEYWGLAISIAIWIGALLAFMLMRRLVERLAFLEQVKFIGSLIRAARAIAGSSLPLACAMAWAISAHIAYATAAYALALGLGIDISWVACLVLVPLVLFVSTLPISFGGWGIRELGMAAILALASVSHAPAVALAIQLGLINTAIGLIGGVVYLALRK